MSSTDETHIFNGSIGVKTFEPQYTFDVNGKIHSSQQIVGKSIDNSSTPSFTWDSDQTTGMFHPSTGAIAFTSNNIEVFRISPSGYVGIGTSSPIYPLHILGNNNFVGNTGSFLEFGYSGAFYWEVVPVDTAGATGSKYGIFCDSNIGAISFHAFSDERIKTNIIPKEDCLDIINKLKVVSYDLKDKLTSQKNFIGFIAQEVEKAIPTAVTNTKNFIPNIYSHFYVKLTNTPKMYIIEPPDNSILEKFQLNDYIQAYTVQHTPLTLRIVDIQPSFLIIETDQPIRENIIFVFGKYISDFKTLEKDIIFSVGIGALQELCKAVEKQGELQKEIVLRLNEKWEEISKDFSINVAPDPKVLEQFIKVVKEQVNAVQSIIDDTNQKINTVTTAILKLFDTSQEQNKTISSLNDSMKALSLKADKVEQLEKKIIELENKVSVTTNALIKLLTKYPVD